MRHTQIVTLPYYGGLVVYSTVCVPHETPEGVMECYTVQVLFGGRTYQMLPTPPDSGDFVDAMDVATGDVVRLFVEGPPGQH